MDYTTTATGATETPCTACGAPAIGCMWTIGNKSDEMIAITSLNDPRVSVTVEYYCAEHEPKEPEGSPDNPVDYEY